MKRFHPSRFGFWGGLLLGLLVALFAFGDLARFLAPAEAQFAPSFRIMDGAHNQLATVSHTGRLLVDTGSTSGLTDHITSVTHVSGRVMIQNVAGTAVTVTGTALDVNCTGCSAASVVNVGHVSGVTHVFGFVRIVNQAGTNATFTGTSLDVNCTGCSAASVVNVAHISGAVHIVNSFGAALHIQGLGVPGGSHGGVLTVQGITGMNPLVVNQGTTNWTIAHITGAVHLAGNVTDQNNSALRVTGVTVFTVMGAIDHIAGTLHLAGSINGSRIHIQGVGSPGQSHGGVLSVQGVTGMNALSVSQSTARWNVDHVTSVTHMRGSVQLVATYGQAAFLTHFGALAVTCYTNAGVAETCGGTGGSGDAVNVFHQSTIRHISSVTHIGGGVFLTNQAGTVVTVTGTALDVNCTGCSAASTVVVSHNSGSLHVAGTIRGAQFHITGLGIPGQTHGGVFTIQGVTGMIGVAVYQDTPRWTVAHITSVTHVYGTISLVARDGTYAGFAGTSLLVASSAAQSGSWSIQAAHQGGEWNIRHVGAVVHVSLVSSSHLSGAIHVSGISNIGSGAPGTYTTQMVCHTTLAVHIAAAAPGLTQIIHLTSTNNNTDQTSWRIYICGIMIVSAHAQGFSLYEGTGTTCVTGKRPLIGSYTPDDSVVLAASGGFSAVAPFPWMSTQNPGNNLCIGQTSRSAGGTISGVISYRAGP